MNDESYDLTTSSKALGRLYPILKDKHGNIIDGFHRQNADPDWPAITVDLVDNPQKLELARLAVNFCRRQLPATEIEQRVAFLVKSGMKPQEIADNTGISLSTIYKYMPQESKNQQKSEIGKLGGLAKSATSSEQTVKTQDTALEQASLHKAAPKAFDAAEVRTCERCGVQTATPKTWHSHTLCSNCEEKANLNPEAWDGFFKYRDRAKAKLVPEATKKVPVQETWDHRVGVMKTQHSTMEDKIVDKLRAKGFTVETDIPITVKEICTTPDFNIILIQKTVHGYIDGTVHNGKRRDKDEDLRLLLKKRFPTDVIVAVDVKGDSDKEADEKIKEIEEAMKW